MDNHAHLRWLIVAILAASLLSCSPKIVEKIVVQHDTTMVHHRDTMFRRDSVYIREWMKGDTVFVDRYRDRYVFRDRWRDSITVREVHDTTLVNKEVEKPLSWSQKTKLGCFWWLIGGLFVCLVWIFRKPILSSLKLFI